MPIRPPLHQTNASRSKAHRDRDHDARRGTPSERGYGHKWRKARLEFLSEHPLCCMCEATGRVTAANVVDHITPHKGDMSLFWDRGNWQALCTEHHSRDKQAMERGGKPVQSVGLDGWPI